MNEKEAREYWPVKEGRFLPTGVGFIHGEAEGYLEAIKKAEMLEECIDGLICGICDAKTAKKVLRKWRREK